MAEREKEVAKGLIELAAHVGIVCPMDRPWEFVPIQERASEWIYSCPCVVRKRDQPKPNIGYLVKGTPIRLKVHSTDNDRRLVWLGQCWLCEKIYWHVKERKNK